MLRFNRCTRHALSTAIVLGGLWVGFVCLDKWHLATAVAQQPSMVVAGDEERNRQQALSPRPALPVEPGPATTRLLAVMAQLERDIVMLTALAAFEEDMLAAARSDPLATLSLRKPWSQCIQSVLAPVCDRLTMLFAPSSAQDISTRKPPTGEDAQ